MTDKTEGVSAHERRVMQTTVGSMKMAKLCWRIGDKSGNGLWHYLTPSIEMGLQANVKAMNERYGAGTHWLEYRDA